MTHARVSRALVLIAFAAGCSQPGPPSEDLENKSWESQKALLPPYPEEARLISFYVGPARPFAYFVDPASVSIGPGGVVRYTLIARSASGATNVSYEAIHCGSYQRKVYAFGRAEGTWVQARNSEWLPIDRGQANPQRALADDFLCGVRPVSSPEEAVRALARGNQPR